METKIPIFRKRDNQMNIVLVKQAIIQIIQQH